MKNEKEYLEELFYLIKQKTIIDRSYYRECRLEEESEGRYESRWDITNEIYLNKIKRRKDELQKITGVSHSDISIIYNMVYK